MMRGVPSKITLFCAPKQEMTSIIYKMKEIFLIYLLIYFILRMNVEVENCILGGDSFTFTFNCPYLMINQLCT